MRALKSITFGEQEKSFRYEIGNVPPKITQVKQQNFSRGRQENMDFSLENQYYFLLCF